MPIRRYAGEDYFFEVESRPFEEGFVFTITAIDRVTGKYSQINDLNFILSQFLTEDVDSEKEDLDEEDPRIEDKDWVLSAEELESFERIAKRLFQNKQSCDYLEFKLDEDRWEGEWANTREAWNSEAWLRDYETDLGKANG